MTRLEQIKARYAVATTNTYSGHMAHLMNETLPDLAALLAVCEAAERWEEEESRTYRGDGEALREAYANMRTAVRAFREGGGEG